MKKISILFVCLLSLLAHGQVSKTINITTAGTLSSQLTTTEKSSITNLTVTGSIDARDFKCMRDEITLLEVVDLSSVTITAFNGIGGTYNYQTTYSYPANETPTMAFYIDGSSTGKTSLKTVHLPTSISSIGSMTFYGCNNLKNIDIPTNITSIQTGAFCYCHGLTGTLNIGAQIKSLGDYAYGICNGITAFVVADGNPNYSSLDGIIYDKNQHTVYQCPAGKVGSISIPSTVTTIWNAAFRECLKLTGNLIIPSSVTTISEHAFSFCSGLTGDLVIPENVNSIGGWAFFECNGLKGNLKIPNSVTSIGDYCFYKCDGLTGLILGNNLNSIGYGAFEECFGINEVLTIPASVVSIGEYAFSACTGVTAFNVEGNNMYYSSPDGVLLNKNQTTIVQYPSGKRGTYIIPNSVISVGNGSFYWCDFSDSFIIPNTLVTIGDRAFIWCTSLTNLTIGSSVNTIADYAFMGCVKLKKIILSISKPLILQSNTFNYVDQNSCTLMVPAGSGLAYKAAAYWKNFNPIIEYYQIQINNSSGGQIYENNLLLTNATSVNATSDSTKTFTFIPNAGYEISTLTYNGVDVKLQIANNQYTTPAVTANGTLNVTFKRTVYKISVQLGGSGTMNLNYYYGDTPAFDFTPSQGSKIQSVFYNGVDVTADLVGNVYTLQAITVNGTLKVVFVTNATGVNATIDSGIYVFKSGSGIYIKGTSVGELINLYTVDGKLLQTVKSTAEGAVIQVTSSGTYLIRIKQKTYKVLF